MAEITMIKNIHYELILTPHELQTIHKSLQHVYIQTPDHLRGHEFKTILDAIETCKRGGQYAKRNSRLSNIR